MHLSLICKVTYIITYRSIISNKIYFISQSECVCVLCVSVLLSKYLKLKLKLKFIWTKPFFFVFRIYMHQIDGMFKNVTSV